MPLQGRTRRMVFLSMLIALAIVLSYFERFIPLPWNIPGMKLGLANVITLSSFYFFSKRDVFAVVLLRVIMTALIVGSMMSFFYSLAGGLLSFIGMALLHEFADRNISTIGISVAGAVLHNIGQLTVLAIVTGRLTIAVSYAPLILVSGIATGIFVGVTARYFIRGLSMTALRGR